MEDKKDLNKNEEEIKADLRNWCVDCDKEEWLVKVVAKLVFTTS